MGWIPENTATDASWGLGLASVSPAAAEAVRRTRAGIRAIELRRTRDRFMAVARVLLTTSGREDMVGEKVNYFRYCG